MNASNIIENDTHTALVIGAGGGIGRALLQQWLLDPFIDKVIAVSRQAAPTKHANNGIEWIQTDYSDDAIDGICTKLKQDGTHITRVCVCNGMLHSDSAWPEKRIEELNAAAMHEVFQVNAVLPMLWLKMLLPVLKGRQTCVVAVFSARIGSISDNRLGGWYSYRSTKAALNMLLKTATIEYARRARNVKLLAFHPGTTNTALSQPFHASVDENEVFDPQSVADRLISIMNHQQADGVLSFVDRDDKPIAW
jgi:NAD(P)-dependent dehydrogenase (short-subunit alcohol dehydrogenase family)